MTLAAFNGHEALTFTDYMDLETGRTLHAEPGGVYDVAPASGRNVPDIPEGWFTPVVPPHSGFMPGAASLAADSTAEGDGAPEPGSEEEAGAEPAPGEDPETGEPQQF